MKKHSLFLLLLLCLLPVSALAAGLSATGNMPAARTGHTATLLQNGKVLIAGGYNGTSHLNTAALYDPTTGTFTATGNMATARSYHSALLLPNGRVLITGGNNGEYLASAELYDPVTGSFSTTGNMITTRGYHAASVLPNGKALIAGGFNGGFVAAAELYDPSSGTFSATGNMTIGRDIFAMTALPNGTVLVSGGYNGGWIGGAELYNPANGTFTATGSMTTTREGHSATLLTNGKVLVAGGSAGSGYLFTAELYNPSTGTFSATGSMTTSRRMHSATILPNGKVLIAGGTNGGYLAAVEIYDPATGTFAGAGNMTAARFEHTATLLPTGRVLIAGGSNGTSLASAELYDSANGYFGSTSTMHVSREHSAALMPNGKVLIAGGYNGTYLNTAVLYDQTTGTFTPTGELNVGRYEPTATVLLNGKILITGGYNGTSLTSAELYDPITEKFTLTGSMSVARTKHTATLLPNGKVLVAGGNNTTAQASTEVYDPATGSFTLSGNMSTPRRWPTSTLLRNGKVLIAGGATDNSYLSSADLYDPATGTLTPTGNMNQARDEQAATILPNGNVLVMGGYNETNGFLTTAEVYNPLTGTFATTGTMATPREWHTATLMQNGKVLVAGGYNGSYSNTAELYDPETGSFNSAGTMTSARSLHTSILLPNGKVLLAGGSNGSDLNTAELYDTGSGFSDSRRPVVTTATVSQGGLTLNGSGFTSNTEGSSGGFNSSATNYPVVKLQRLDNDEGSFLLPDTGSSWSSTSFTSQSLYGLPMGHYRATVFANAVPSHNAIVRIAPIATIAPAAIGFPSTYTHTTNGPSTVVLTNSGSAEMTVTRSITGINADQFAISPTSSCGSTLAPGGSCTIAVTFTPTTEGNKSAILSINTNDPDDPVKSIPITGTAVSMTHSLTTIFPGNGSGSISYSTGGSCTTASGGCSQSLDDGSSVTLTPSPSNGSFFQGWGGDCSGTGTCSLIMTNAKTAAATFTSYTPLPMGSTNHDLIGAFGSTGAIPLIGTNSDIQTGNLHSFGAAASSMVMYDITTSITGSGTIVCLTPVEHGYTSVCTISADTYHELDSIEGCGGTLSGNTYTTGPITDNCTITAHFSQTSFPLNVTLSGGGSGTISGTTTGSPASLSFSTSGSSPVSAGASVILTASPDVSSIFREWTGCDSVSGTQCTVAMAAARSVSARFGRNIHTSAAVDVTGSNFTTSISGGRVYYRANVNFPLDSNFTAQAGDQVTIDVNFANGKRLKLDGDPGTSQYLSFGVSAPLASGTGSGSGSSGIVLNGVEGSLKHNPTFYGSYGYGNSVVSISSNPDDNLTDSSFSFSGVTVTYNIGSLQINGVERAALFKTFWMQIAGKDAGLLMHNLTVSHSGAGTGTVHSSPGTDMNCVSGTCSQSYDPDTIVTLVATPAPLSAFQGWNGCDTVDESNHCIITLSSSKNVTATFFASPQIGGLPTSYDFGDRLVGTGTTSRSFTITNSGGLPLSISGISLSGQGADAYAVTPNTCSSLTPTIAAGSSCTVNVSFTPAAQQLWPATLTIVSNDPATPTTIELSGKGVAVLFDLTLTFSGYGSGSVSFSFGTTCTANCSQSFGGGTLVQLTSTANAESTFTNWIGCDSVTGNICTVTMSGVKDITVGFNASTLGPPAMVATTGQTTSYAAGDDGALQMGVAWPEPRFTNPDGSIPVSGGIALDRLTGLEWPQDGGTPTFAGCSGGIVNWQGALDYVACLNANNYLGHNDWRLPNINELASLVDRMQVTPALPTGHSFNGVQPQQYYWSSSVDMDSMTGAWVVFMGSGETTVSNVNNGCYVWPVRTGQIDNAVISVPKTGQTTSLAAGDDGNLQQGVSWPQPRFTNTDGSSPVNDTIVLDRLTGLEWPQDGITPTFAGCTGGAMTWQGALDYVACINASNYLGHSDWRLPNINELNSLINRQQPRPFEGLNIAAGNYWSSTSKADNTSYAWFINGYGGTQNYYPKTENQIIYTLPVRTSDMRVPIISVPPPVVFPTTSTYGSSSIQEVSIGNTGTGSLIVGSITIADTDASHFSLTPGTCPSLAPTIAAGTSCSVYLTFTPTSVGAKNANLQIASSDPTTPTATVALSGTAYDPPPLGTISINNGAAYTTSATVDLNLNAMDNSGIVSEMRFSNNNLTWSSWELYSTTKASWTLMSLGGDGSKQVYVQYKDSAGNISGSFTDSIMLDTTAPTVTMTAMPAGLYNSSAGTFTFSASESSISFECKTDSGTFSACPGSYAFSGLADGSHTFSVRATDQAGITGTATSYSWVIDTTPPNTLIVAMPTSPTNMDNTSFNILATETGSTIEWSLDGGPYTNFIPGTMITGLADGSHTMAARAKDPAGNYDPTPASYTWILDRVAPETTITSSPPSQSASSSASFSFSASESGSSFECSMDGAAWSSCSSGASYNGLTSGAHTFQVRSTDSAGNTDQSPASYSFSVTSGNVSASGSYYATIAEAFGAVADGGTIKARDIEFMEDLVLNRQVTLSLAGGYDTGFGASSGLTTIKGSLTIAAGTLVVDRMALQ